MPLQRIPLGKFFAPRKLTPCLAALARVSLFSQLSPLELGIVDGLLHQREYQGGEIVFDEGEEGQAIYLVQEGEVVLGRHGQGAAGHIAVLGPGAFFGDMALIDNLPRTAQARATQPTRLAVFFREDFIGLMDTHARIASKIALQLAREMGRRLRQQQAGDSQSWRQHL
jgi:CRP-like cAMP-binding protein